MYHDGIMKRGEHKDATLAVLQCSINISLALLHLNDLRKISQKKLWMAFQTYKKQLIYSIQPLTTFQQSKKLNIEVEILTIIYYLKIEHINFLIHQSSVQ